jgi:hypothetical protein
VGLVSSGVNIINLFATLCMFLLVDIQFLGWKKSFKNNWNSDIQMQYNQMRSSSILYSSIFLLITIIEIISFAGLENMIKIWRKFHWMQILSRLVIIICFSFMIIVFVCPSKPAESFAQHIVEVSVL